MSLLWGLIKNPMSPFCTTKVLNFVPPAHVIYSYDCLAPIWKIMEPSKMLWLCLSVAMMDLEVSDHFFYIKRIPSTTKSCVALQCVDHEFIIINPIVINNYNYYSKQDYIYHYYHHYHHGIIIANNNNHYYHCNTSKYKIIIL